MVNTMVAYNHLHNGFECLTQKHTMLCRSLEGIKGREDIFQEIRYYIEQIKHVTNMKDWR